MSQFDNDFMEYGNSHLVALPDGWFLNIRTKETIDPDGCVFNENGDLVYDPFDDHQPIYDKEDYDFDWNH